MQKSVAIPLTLITGLVFWFNLALYPYLLDFLIIPVGSLIAAVTCILCIIELVGQYHRKLGAALLPLNLFFAIYPMWLLVSSSHSYSIP